MPPASAGKLPPTSAALRIGAHGQARDRLLEVLTPVVAATGHDLEDVTVTSAGRRSLVRVIVDADGGSTSTPSPTSAGRCPQRSTTTPTAAPPSPDPTCSRSARRASTVPSPKQRHWRRSRGRLVQVSRSLDGTAIHRAGVIGAPTMTGVTLDVAGSPRRLGYGEVGKALVQIEFNRKRTEKEA